MTLTNLKEYYDKYGTPTKVSKDGKLFYFDEPHLYIYEGVGQLTSMTSFIHLFEGSPFKQSEQAEKYAKKHGYKKTDVLDLWADSGNMGTHIHSLLEFCAERKISTTPHWSAVYKGGELQSSNLWVRNKTREKWIAKINTAQQFAIDFFDSGRLKPIATEIILAHPKYKLSGMFDNLSLDSQNRKWIVDYKTNNKIVKHNYSGVKMKYPFDYYDCCNYVHYSMQQSGYAVIMEDVYGVKTEGAYLVHIAEDGYELIPVLDLKNEFREALQIYKEKTQQ